MPTKITKAKLYMYMILMIVAGTTHTILIKLQSKEESLGKPYKHFFFQTFIMFLGETLSIFTYIFKRKNKNNNLIDDENPPKQASPLIILIPALCDLCGSTLTFFALLSVNGSLFQMAKGALLFVTAFLSICLLKTRLYRHHLLGLVIILGGMIMVALSQESNDSEGGWVYIVLLLVSLIFNGAQAISEEIIIRKYNNISPSKIVGWEGIWGSLIYLFLMLIFCFVKCNPGSENICAENANGKLFLETPIFALDQIINNCKLFFLVFGDLFCIALYNYYGVNLTKHLSSASRLVLGNTKTLLVWTFFLIIPSQAQETFKVLQLFGFILNIFGALLYNEIIVIPCFGFNRYTKEKKVETAKVAIRKKKSMTSISYDVTFNDEATVSETVD
jgi:drug/metabolite transporter (DMT)-like permease